MYCTSCGQPLALNQPVCARCGRPSAAFAPAPYPATAYPPSGYIPVNRVQRHIQTLGILWLVFSSFALLAWLAAIPFLGFFFGRAGHGFYHGDIPFPMSLHWIFPFVTAIVYLRSGLGILVGIGLLRRERWARPMALVVGILTLIKIPFGTALGIYTLWVLAPMQSALEYDAVAS